MNFRSNDSASSFLSVSGFGGGGTWNVPCQQLTVLVRSVAFQIDGPVDPNRFMPWIQEVVQRDGPDILRSKGILAFPGESRRYVFQGVHMILDGDLQRAWKPEEKQTSRLVFIGRKLKEKELREGFGACAAFQPA